MIINKPINNVKPAFSIFKPLIDENGNQIENLYITDNCELYNQEDVHFDSYMKNIPKSNKYYYTDSRGRKYLKYFNSKCNQLARLCKISFDEPLKSVDFYKNHELDHIDPSVPVDNSIYNTEWVTHDENMYRAGKTGVMIKKYNKELIGRICEDIIKGERQIDIAKKYNVNENLIFDIKSGKSHRSVSEQYLDKGFKYYDKPKLTKQDKEQRAHEICKLLEKYPDKTDQEIANMAKTKRQNVNNIRIKYTYTNISDQYNINFRKAKSSK